MASDYWLSLCVEVVYVKFGLSVPHLLRISLVEINDGRLGLRSLGFYIVLFVEICRCGKVNRGTVLRSRCLLLVRHHHSLVHGRDSDVQLNTTFLARLVGDWLSRLLQLLCGPRFWSIYCVVVLLLWYLYVRIELVGCWHWHRYLATSGVMGILWLHLCLWNSKVKWNIVCFLGSLWNFESHTLCAVERSINSTLSELRAVCSLLCDSRSHFIEHFLF